MVAFFPWLRLLHRLMADPRCWPMGGEMPVFGALFARNQHIALALPDGQPMMVGLPLANLLAYLETIQTTGQD